MQCEPLEGIRIVEYGDFISAPFCGKILADLGANVVKIENPGGGDPSRRYGPFPNDIPDQEKSGLFHYLNMNKFGVTLNIQDGAGREILGKLLQNSDIFIENMPMKMVQDFELDHGHLQHHNPNLITVSITPFGRMGPYKNFKGEHINCCALGGASYGLGYPDREPLTVPVFHYDYQAGLHGAAATLVALIGRDKVGGQHIDIGEADVVACHVGVISLIYEAFLGITIKREGRRAPGSLGVYPCSLYPCKDGYVMATARTKREWERFLAAFGNPDWGMNPRYQDPILTK
jgi:crotonobetainyl-CoA:carnitine CoA-transferase CaiB-like acyl-CoA transferase